MAKFLVIIGLSTLLLAAFSLVSARFRLGRGLDRTVELAAWLVAIVMFGVIMLLVCKGPGSAQINDAIERVVHWLHN
jgi:hypothetical protein